MQFVTIREPHAGEYRVHRNRGGRGGFWFDRFDYAVAHDPTAEHTGCWWSSDPSRACAQFLRPDIESGVREGVADALGNGLRTCCASFTVPFAQYHDVDTTPDAVRFNASVCVAQYVLPLLKPIDPLRAEWLTSDVVAVAKGIHAEPTADRYIVLSDALRDAGCDDAFIHDHLQLCPDHGPSCWVAEMILHQTRAAGA